MSFIPEPDRAAQQGHPQAARVRANIRVIRAESFWRLTFTALSVFCPSDWQLQLEATPGVRISSIIYILTWTTNRSSF